MKTKITPEVFTLVKALLDNKVKKGVISKTLNVSWHSVRKISMFDKFEDIAKDKRERRLSRNISKTTTKNTDLPDTPIHDVLIEIRDELRTLTSYISKAGGKGSFRLW